MPPNVKSKRVGITWLRQNIWKLTYRSPCKWPRCADAAVLRAMSLAYLYLCQIFELEESMLSTYSFCIQAADVCFTGYQGIDKELSGQFVKCVELFQAEGLVLTSVNANHEGFQCLRGDLKKLKQVNSIQRLLLPAVGRGRHWRRYATLLTKHFIPNLIFETSSLENVALWGLFESKRSGIRVYIISMGIRQKVTTE